MTYTFSSKLVALAALVVVLAATSTNALPSECSYVAAGFTSYTLALTADPSWLNIKYLSFGQPEYCLTQLCIARQTVVTVLPGDAFFPGDDYTSLLTYEQGIMWYIFISLAILWGIDVLFQFLLLGYAASHVRTLDTNTESSMSESSSSAGGVTTSSRSSTRKQRSGQGQGSNEDTIRGAHDARMMFVGWQRVKYCLMILVGFIGIIMVFQWPGIRGVHSIIFYSNVILTSLLVITIIILANGFVGLWLTFIQYQSLDWYIPRFIGFVLLNMGNCLIAVLVIPLAEALDLTAVRSGYFAGILIIFLAPAWYLFVLLRASCIRGNSIESYDDARTKADIVASEMSFEFSHIGVTISLCVGFALFTVPPAAPTCAWTSVGDGGNGWMIVQGGLGLFYLIEAVLFLIMTIISGHEARMAAEADAPDSGAACTRCCTCWWSPSGVYGDKNADSKQGLIGNSANRGARTRSSNKGSSMGSQGRS